MKFYCIFSDLHNFELYKEVGQIPYYLAKKYGYESTIVSFDNDSFTNFNELEEIKLKIIQKKYENRILNYLLIVSFLIKNSKNIDILNCYHYTVPTIIFFLVYKIFNRKGIIYHVLDMDYENSISNTGKESIKYLFKSKFLIFLYKYIIDFATIETKKVYNVFINSHPIFKEKLMYMPIYVCPNPLIESNKKNQIISVGRIGAHQKASEIVLESYKRAMMKLNTENWVLKMVGPVSEDFKAYTDEFFVENPDLKDSIIFTGNIEEKDELYKIYSESKIFCLPSRSGSFEIVFVEALYYSNYLIITDVGTGKYLVDISDFGKTVEIDNIEEISNELVDTIKNYETYYINNNIDFKKLITEEFGFENHTHNLNKMLQKIKSEKSK